MAQGAGTARTVKDDLRTGTPFWLKTPNIAVAHCRLDRRQGWDAIIVGSGVSGALLAEALTRQGLGVLIVDRRPPARGSTPASTAMIQHEIDIPLIHHIRDMGRPRAEAVWRRSVRAVGDLLRLVDETGIDCRMQAKRAIYLSGNVLGARALKAEAEARDRAGIAAEYLNAAALRDRFGMQRSAAILSEASASANPAQLTAGLLAVAQARGAVVASPVEITDLAELPGGVALATDEGRVLACRNAIFCTGYEFLPQMQSPRHRITSTWALASRTGIARPDWLDDMLVWEAAEPYLYFRTDLDGRIIAGGEDEDNPVRNDDPALLARKGRTIVAKLQDLTGIRIGRPAYVWSAPFGNTTDGLPIIDLVPGHDRVHAVMGFGGNGITFSMIAAQVVAAAIAGKPDPDAGLFAFDRDG
ncbi:NAD(P)/FAD-dependent oxidoreductase [Paracoccus spongiarum]|uniref:FAD-dependent oxidoreductase n=1 Tax=Paracoccus spongiarum TaxID=3064387 RepID=A0ABT9JG07_9RHOB|nr:FAD-dependent oxidoreductase [Paracoccus sp. 2205BS29-5]MDP5308550.1 FAD-dependent oxidoreductase [Paracoccus sp. 2205BS29-5]